MGRRMCLTILRRLVRNVFLICAFGAVAPSVTHARGIVVALDAQITAGTVMLLSSSSSCTNLAYDLNGNRISQTTAAVASGPVIWASSKFGCFTWSSQ